MLTSEIGEKIGEGAGADVHAYGSHVIKLYRSGGHEKVFTEARNMVIAAGHGLAVPEALLAGRFEGRWGLVQSRAAGRPMATPDDIGRPVEEMRPLLEEMAELQLAMHARPEAGLPPLKSKLAAAIRAAPQLDDAHKQRLVAGLADLPDGDRLCHGDFHPLNLIGEDGHWTIIDWLDATSGPPAADVCRSALILSLAGPDLAETYMVAYAERSEIDIADIEVWRPYLAAARLREDPPGVGELLDWAREI